MINSVSVPADFLPITDEERTALISINRGQTFHFQICTMFGQNTKYSITPEKLLQMEVYIPSGIIWITDVNFNSSFDFMTHIGVKVAIFRAIFQNGKLKEVKRIKYWAETIEELQSLKF